ncbi:NADH-ubiquinone oxidoreductase 12 kDa subunit [Abortiporus biennis]|nr:NADH-ubiquinone oxidoreductase 12 kDa subunit [Abortiporus biennis]
MAIDEARAEALAKRINDRDALIRESWVRAMEARIVRSNLEKCYRLEGVNHYENCKVYADRYADMLKENKVKGYKTIDV